MLSRFYERARSRSGADGHENQTVESEQELTSLKREIDSLATELPDEDAFDVALRVSDSKAFDQ